MENKIDLSVIENTGVSIDKLDKSLNETVKVLGDIKKSLKDNAKASQESKPAAPSSGGASKAKEPSTAKQDKFNAMAKATQVVDDTWDKYKEKKQKRDQKKLEGITIQDESSGVANKANSKSATDSASSSRGLAPKIENSDYLNKLGPVRSALQIKEEEVEKIMDLDNKVAENASENNKKTAKEKTETYNSTTESIGIGLTAAVDLGNQLNEVSRAAMEEEVIAAEERNEKEKSNLKKKYDEGLISKKEYDKKVAESDKTLADKKAELAKKQAERDKAMAIFGIAVNTAMAIMKIWADVPKADFGVGTIVLTAVAAAVGAAQIAAAAAAPLPKARKGGLIAGSSHENGGVLIEAEGGEAILSRAAMSAFPGVANLMNAAALSGGINDGGYAARSMAAGSVEFGNRGAASSSQGIDYERLASMMSEKMSQAKIYVAVTDINDGQKNYARISDLAKI